MATLNYYQILGLKTDATPDEIREAFRKLMRKYHPDLSELPREEATIKSAEINEAYRVLSDPKKRADYDNLLRLRGEKVITYKQEPKHDEPKIGKDPGGKDSPEPWSSEEGVRKRSSDTSFSDEEFLKLLKDRAEFKRLIEKYYAIHSSRIRLNWSNADLREWLGRPSNGGKTQIGVETDNLDLYDVELSGANISDTVLEKINFRSCNLTGANLQGTVFYDCEFTECNFTGANFTGAVIQNPKKIQKCQFVNARFDKVAFRGQIVFIRDSNFKGAIASGMQFTDLLGKPKPALKDHVLACLKEQQWRNLNAEQLVAQIEGERGGAKKGFWPFGKK
ncbi:MAG: DnaJ domain-containing protein [bacterium]|jgi:curved DNA-binding protein CbpA